MKLSIWVLLIIVFTGAIFRLVNLSDVPAGLHYDEAQSGYNGFLLLTQGKNLLGEKLPLDIDYFGDHRPALSSYLTAGSIFLFGLNEFSTRLPVAIFGIFLIVLTYFFARICFNDEKVALISAGLVAISPLAIIFSRASSDVIIEITWELAGILCLVVCISKKRPRMSLASFIFFTLAYFTYQTSRLLTIPLGTMAILAAARQFNSDKKIILFAFIPLMLYAFFPLAYFLHTPIGQGRFNQVSVFNYPEVQRSLDEYIREDGHNSNVLVSRFLHNKPLGYLADISRRYSIFFSPNPILFSLDQPDRYFVPGIGPITLIEYFSLVLAIAAFLYTKQSRPLKILCLAFLLLAPVPSALTFEATPNFLRAAYLIPFWQIMAAFGLLTFVRSVKNRKIYAILLLLIMDLTAWQLITFSHQYFVHQPARFEAVATRATEMKPLAIFLSANRTKYTRVALSEYDGAYIYYLFYNKINIFSVPTKRDGKYYSGNFQVDNLRFFVHDCLGPGEIFAERFSLFVFREACLRPVWFNKIEDFKRSDGSTSLTAYTPNEDIYKNYFAYLATASSQLEKKERLKVVADTYIDPKKQK